MLWPLFPCLLSQKIFAVFTTISELRSEQQTTSRTCVFGVLHFGHYFLQFRLEIHFPPRCLGSLGTVVIARKKKKLFRFFFSHTHIFQLEVGFVSHRGLSVLSEVVCTSGVSPDPVLIAFSIKEITSRLTSFRNNTLGCVLSGTKQSPHIGKLQIQA